MISNFKFLGLAFFFLTATAQAAQANALPKHIQANYTVSKNGSVFAKVREQYAVTGNTYKVESITKGVGIYALLGTRKLTSTGKVTPQGLQPARFELHQGRGDKKTLISDFDWPKNTLHMQIKGVNQDAVLSAGTQDLANYAYQFMFLPRPIKDSLTVTLTTGKKLNVYQYKINEESLNIAGKTYKTVHLVPSDQSKDQIETKELWLAVEQNYLMVKFLMVDEGGAKLEQTLTELHVD